MKVRAKTKTPSPQKSTYGLADVRELPVVQANTAGHRLFSHLDPYITTQAIFLEVPRMLEEERTSKREI